MEYAVKCTYCGIDTIRSTSKEFYGVDYGTYVYHCPTCKAYVGSHKGSLRPLGTPANEELRFLRRWVHSLIDPYWKSRKMSRSTVYARMSKFMDLPPSETHVGMFNEEQCKKIIRAFRR